MKVEIHLVTLVCMHVMQIAWAVALYFVLRQRGSLRHEVTQLRRQNEDVHGQSVERFYQAGRANCDVLRLRAALSSIRFTMTSSTKWRESDVIARIDDVLADVTRPIHRGPGVSEQREMGVSDE